MISQLKTLPRAHCAPWVKNPWVSQLSSASVGFSTTKNIWSSACWRRVCPENSVISPSWAVTHARSARLPWDQTAQNRAVSSCNVLSVSKLLTASSNSWSGSNVAVFWAILPFKWSDKITVVTRLKKRKKRLLRKLNRRSSVLHAAVNKVLKFPLIKLLMSKIVSWLIMINRKESMHRNPF